jgi:hypothetical protein
MERLVMKLPAIQLPTKYHFSTLWHEQELGSGEAEPFAVIVESRRYVYCIAYGLIGDDSTVSGQVLRSFPDVLKEQVAQASKVVSGSRRLALRELFRGLTWNVYADEIRTKWSPRGIESFTQHLFAKHVENWVPSVCATEQPLDAPLRATYHFKLGLAYA